jgi:Cu-processing system permease protein
MKQSLIHPRSMGANVLTLGLRDLREALLSRWFLLYTMAFAALGLCVSYVSASSSGGAGLAGFGRTSAGLVNLVLLIVPLMALTAGASAISGERERGMLAYLLVQPISRLELLLARFIALAVALAMAISIGVGVSAWVIAMKEPDADLGALPMMVGLTIALAIAMLSVGLLIGVLCRRTAVAVGVAVFVWLMLVFATDLGLLAATMALRLNIETLLGLAMASPLQVFKMWSLQGIDASLDVLGPAGLYAQTEYGRSIQFVFGGVLLAWVVIPLGLGAFAFGRRSPL